MEYTIMKDKRSGYNVLFEGIELCNRKTINECYQYIASNKNEKEVRTPLNKHSNY